MNIYLIRHGQTDWNSEHRFQGVSDVELNDQGRKEASFARNVLKDTPIDRVVTSDLKRAKETATILIGDRDIPLEETEGFRECHFGKWEGLTFNQITGEYPEGYHLWRAEDMDYKGHEGESPSEFRERIKKHLYEVAGGQDEAVAIVCHAGVIRMILTEVLCMRTHDRYAFEIDNGSVTKLEYNDEKFRGIFTPHSLRQMEEYHGTNL